MIVDSHAHLNEDALNYFVKMMASSYENESILVLSNSVDYDSSLRNLELARACRGIRAFVGIHPEVFSRESNKVPDKESLDGEVSQVSNLVTEASGIGEIGLDEKYGSSDLQEYLLEKMFAIAEHTRLPVTIHSRGSVSKIRQILETYDVKGNVLFHWFAGSDIELKELQEDGFNVSFGPSVLYSKRLSQLAKISDSKYTLVETDAPTRFSGITGEYPSTPYLTSSVVFKLALVWEFTFSETLELLHPANLMDLSESNLHTSN